jgi:probable rRNA maturation factor
MGTVEIVVAHPAGRRLARRCSTLIKRLLTETGRPGAGVTLLLASDREVRRLNRAWLDRDRTTDVLSFPAGGDLEPGRPHLGDIAISLSQAARQARRAGWPLRNEVALLLTHGFLHLLGYDHETDRGTMRRLEEGLLGRAARVRLAQRRVPWGVPGAAPGRGRRRRPED